MRGCDCRFDGTRAEATPLDSLPAHRVGTVNDGGASPQTSFDVDTRWFESRTRARTFCRKFYQTETLITRWKLRFAASGCPAADSHPSTVVAILCDHNLPWGVEAAPQLPGLAVSMACSAAVDLVPCIDSTAPRARWSGATRSLDGVRAIETSAGRSGR